jgi:hypothetical protein
MQGGAVGIDSVGRKELALGGVVTEKPQTNLLHVVEALIAAGSFARRADRRKEQGDDEANDGDDDEELDEREGGAAAMEAASHGASVICDLRRRNGGEGAIAF